jgi:hypothetical protein
MILAHLRVEQVKFKQICVQTIQEFMDSKLERNSLNRLYKLSVISTSPFLHTERTIQGWIEANMKEVLDDNALFLWKYIMPSLVTIEWQTQGDVAVSETISCWRLYIQNLALRVKERPEVPAQILEDQFDESLQLFQTYFGDVQPCKSRAIAMRSNIFVIVRTITQTHPAALPNPLLLRVWYLLYIAAISGALDQEIQNCKPEKEGKDNTPFLGLDVTHSDFCNYGLALSKLSKKFESEFDRFSGMATFIRANY